jgi:trypsin
MKLPLLSSIIAVASAAGLRNSGSRDLGLVFDTEAEVNGAFPARETAAIEAEEEAATNSFKEMRIIGGDTSGKGEFPYTVSLEDDIGHFCGATLIRRDIVMCAAHCAGGPMWARVGAHSITRNEGTRIKVKKEIVSKKYNPSNTNYDFMILVLEEPAPKDIPLARLHDGSDELRDGDSLTVIGWGNTATSGWNMPDKKQHVEVKYIDTDDCNSRNSYNGQITNAMMCAGEDRGGEDACQGDSGGPLVRLGERGEPDELVGVVSWGYGCGSATHPGVYARITEVLDWIEDTIEKESKFSDADYSVNSDSGSTISTSDSTQTTSNGGGFSDKPSSWENSSWREVVHEDFTSDFGSNRMQKGGVHAKQYDRAYGRIGVARIQHGKGKKSSFSTEPIHLEERCRRKSEWKVSMSFMGKGMDEYEDRFCVQVKEDDGKWKDLKCFMSGEDFVDGEWTEASILFTVDDTTDNVEVRWVCEGQDRRDDVIFDWVKVECEA